MMPRHTHTLYLSEQLRQCERQAMIQLGQSEDDLMLLAGTQAFASLQHHFPKAKTITVFCGAGNNGGDGYVLARLAHRAKLSVVVYAYQTVSHLSPAAQRAAQAAIDSGVDVQPVPTTFNDASCDLMVDALIGIGLNGAVRAPMTQAIEYMNHYGCPILSLDVPSGLNADTGTVANIAVKATITTTFIAPTVGLYTHQGAEYCGLIITHSLNLDAHLASLTPAAALINPARLLPLLMPRSKAAHKGLFGHVLIIGGGPGMPGAVALAAQAALRVGAGRVTIATHPHYAHQIVPGLAEVMIHGVAEAKALAPLLSTATVTVIGPGLGESDWAKSLLKETLSMPRPLIVDASALQLLSQYPSHSEHWILTPHPGEAASLLTCSAHDVQNNRLAAVKAIQQRYGGVVVLKGCGSLITDLDHHIALCNAGNPGMATAGMGDVLSGVIGGLTAQGLSPTQAAQLGVWLHATAGDRAANSSGERGLMASDLMPHLHQLVNPENH